MGSSRTMGPAPSTSRRHPGSGGSSTPKAQTKGTKPAQEQRLSPETQCYSAPACTDLSTVECRILHNLPSITIVLTRPSTKGREDFYVWSKRLLRLKGQCPTSCQGKCRSCKKKKMFRSHRGRGAPCRCHWL